MYGLNAQGQHLFDAGVSCAVLAGAAVALRIFSKFWHKNGVHIDDHLIIAAVLLFWTNVAMMQWGSITGGGGIEMQELFKLAAKDPSKLKMVENYLKAVLISFFIYITSICAVKLSILYFYRRIFFVTKNYQQISLAVILFTVAWYIATIVATAVCDIPMEGFWNPRKRKRSLNFGVIFLVTGIIDTLIDVLILVLPVRVAFTLQLPTRTRLAVAGIFALGGFAVITNIIRIQYVYRPHSRYVSFSAAELWSNIHQMTAIICACAPMYKKLWITLSNSVSNVVTRYAISLRSLIRSGGKDTQASSYVRMGHLGGPSGSVRSEEQDIERGFEFSSSDKATGHCTISVVGGTDDNDDERRLHIPQDRITCERKIDVV